MTKRYTILQKKLQELEFELHQVFTLPSETPCHHILSEGIEQRFVFLNNLLSAEVASHPKKPHHLQHIATRLAELEIAFHEWDDFKTTSSSSLALLDHIETASKCSCTESCLNDDGGDGEVSADLVGSQVCEEPEVFFDGVMEELAEKTVEDETERVERKEKGRGWVGGCCRPGSMASGVMVGAALMAFLMVNFSGCFHYEMGHDFILTPT